MYELPLKKGKNAPRKNVTYCLRSISRLGVVMKFLTAVCVEYPESVVYTVCSQLSANAALL
jgi:hypothetical protein